MPALARDVMDPHPITVRPDDSVETVVRTLREHDEPGDRHLPHLIEPLRRFEQRLRGLVTVATDTTVEEAARLVHERGHNRLPVVEGDRLVGVVTRVDLLGALVR